MALEADKPCHILLVGPPGLAKTDFLLEILNSYKNKSFFTLGAHSTKAGMIDALFTKRPKYLLLDELEHMPIADKVVLLSLMQSGIVSETKIKKTRETQLNTWVFATCNNLKKMPEALLSRFMIIKVEKYDRDEFIQVGIKILMEQEGIEELDIATYIAENVYDSLENPNPRDCIKAARLSKGDMSKISIVIGAMK
jgi:Holliday junction DNA helicase RuvB